MSKRTSLDEQIEVVLLAKKIIRDAEKRRALDTVLETLHGLQSVKEQAESVVPDPEEIADTLLEMIS